MIYMPIHTLTEKFLPSYESGLTYENRIQAILIFFFLFFHFETFLKLNIT